MKTNVFIYDVKYEIHDNQTIITGCYDLRHPKLIEDATVYALNKLEKIGLIDKNDQIGSIAFRCVVKCKPVDTFTQRIGKRLAYNKAVYHGHRIAKEFYAYYMDFICQNAMLMDEFYNNCKDSIRRYLRNK
jgi:hypothetical protein